MHDRTTGELVDVRLDPAITSVTAQEQLRQTVQQYAANTGHKVGGTFCEGETVVIRGGKFLVAAIKRNRLILKPLKG